MEGRRSGRAGCVGTGLEGGGSWGRDVNKNTVTVMKQRLRVMTTTVDTENQSSVKTSISLTMKAQDRDITSIR